MSAKKAGKATTQSPEALVVHANLCRNIADFLVNRPYLKQKGETWDPMSDRVAVFLSAITDVHRAHGPEKPEPEHLFDWTALHAVSGLDERDINLDRLEEVRKLVVSLLESTPDEYARFMARMTGEESPKLGEMMVAVEQILAAVVKPVPERGAALTKG